MSGFSDSTPAILQAVITFEEKHPYVLSFVASLLIISFLLFHTPSLDTTDEDYMPPESIELVNIETLAAPKRVVKKEVSTDATSEPDPNNVERAVGTADIESAVDIAFYPNVAPPRPIGKLKRFYPSMAEKMEIEATVNVQLYISATGQVRQVKILAIRLSKALPVETSNRLHTLFSNDARKILMGARFTPPVVNGKKVPIKFEMPLRFRLNQ